MMADLQCHYQQSAIRGLRIPAHLTGLLLTCQTLIGSFFLGLTSSLLAFTFMSQHERTILLQEDMHFKVLEHCG